MVMTSQGTWLRMYYVDGWGEPDDGNWFDMTAFDISTYEFQPGDAVYYYRQPTGGPMEISF